MSKLMSIVFDDGPNGFMNSMVDKFKAAGFKCGFAIIGKKINDNTVPMLKYAIDNGCQLVSHGQVHLHMSQLEETEQMIEELATPIETVEKLLGYKIKMARLPFLAWNDRVLDVAKDLGLPLLGCGGDGGNDWNDAVPAEDIVKAVVGSARDGAIACLHVTDRTCKALDEILPALKEQGYELVTPDEIFEKMGVKEIPLGVQIHNVNDI